MPLYWPEFDRYWQSSGREWFTRFLIRFSVAGTVRQLEREAFIKEAWSVVGRKVNKRAKLEEIYELASQTTALPADPEARVLVVRETRAGWPVTGPVYLV